MKKDNDYVDIIDYVEYIAQKFELCHLLCRNGES